MDLNSRPSENGSNAVPVYHFCVLHCQNDIFFFQNKIGKRDTTNHKIFKMRFLLLIGGVLTFCFRKCSNSLSKFFCDANLREQFKTESYENFKYFFLLLFVKFFQKFEQFNVTKSNLKRVYVRWHFQVSFWKLLYSLIRNHYCIL